ncbi:imidazole glycerol phosphate synthase subunit HisF, partial [Candidatus Aerophobetes bacterium]|nr:imidazole glycerol phosphate synthase subunit HisF [Candidatus Aerophobetes bacterium]
SPEHIFEVFIRANADAALAASIFHYREFSIQETKKFLAERGIVVRI